MSKRNKRYTRLLFLVASLPLIFGLSQNSYAQISNEAPKTEYVDSEKVIDSTQETIDEQTNKVGNELASIVQSELISTDSGADYFVPRQSNEEQIMPTEVIVADDQRLPISEEATKETHEDFSIEATQNTINVLEENSQTENNFTLEDYENSSALELAAAVRAGKVTSVQLVQFAYQKIKVQDPSIHAMISLREKEALEEAAQLKDEGQPFFGVPLLLKGLGHTIAGGINSNGLTFSKDHLSSTTGSFTTAFQKAGFIIIGQTNFPELGLKNITDSKLYGPTSSPWNPSYQAGGSSGGSAAGVAAGYAPVGSGSDAGGSIRIPASWNGIIGFKPSRGILLGNSASERNQTVHFAQTKTMADTKELFHTLLKEELPQTVLDPTIKIAYSFESPVGTVVQPEAIEAVEKAVAFLRAKGYQLEQVSQPYNGVTLMENYYMIAASSAGVVDFLAKQKLKRAPTIEEVDWTTWALMQTSKEITKEDIAKVWDSIKQVETDLEKFHQEYPLFLTPTTASTAPLVGDTLMQPEHIEAIKNIMNLTKAEKLQLIYDQWLPSLAYTPFTQVANLTGAPAISLPTYVSRTGLPLGVQFTASRNEDYLLLAIGEFFEMNQQFNQITESLRNEEERKPDESNLIEDVSAKLPGNQVEKNGKTILVEEEKQMQETNILLTANEQDGDKVSSTSVKKPMNQLKMLPKTGENTPKTLEFVGVILLVMSGGIIFIYRSSAV